MKTMSKSVTWELRDRPKTAHNLLKFIFYDIYLIF